MRERGEKPSRRTYPRTSVYLTGLFSADDQSTSCDILNISAGGARIRLIGTIGTCQTFRLGIPPFGEFPCAIIWQNGDDLGLKFHDDPAAMAEIVLAMAVYGQGR